MYQLMVCYPDDSVPREMHGARTAAEVLRLIPKLLHAHDGCERVIVMYGPTRLFSVDCSGNSEP